MGRLFPQRQGGNAFMLRIKVPGASQRGAGPGDRSHADAFAEGQTEPGVRQPLRRSRRASGHSAPLDPHCRRSRIWQRFWDVVSPRCRPAATRPATSAHARSSGIDAGEVVEALARWPRPSRPSSRDGDTPTTPQVQDRRDGLLEDCAGVEINDIGLWPAEHRDGPWLQRAGWAADSPTENGWPPTSTSSSSGPGRRTVSGRGQALRRAGNRENRGLARMRYLAQELGPEDSGPPSTSAPASHSRPPGAT